MFKTEQCKRCGKMFIPAIEHIYKLEKNGRLCKYCSYTCWRKDGGDNGSNRR